MKLKFKLGSALCAYLGTIGTYFWVTSFIYIIKDVHEEGLLAEGNYFMLGIWVPIAFILFVALPWSLSFSLWMEKL
jgi:hypothetical protein